ncbi:MerR family transcriptional regulator [Micromonospora auratinigra]|uniref:MerR HTH family regulatory protein n=1 Tax=Micromonospora auratinigra TaxID=261654 RepID=A0A1A8ZVL8_9ACTN|nr:MerR family transcriptional regulator [Micromonospora auratinigra]SBT47918.1 MerR HTH family regulatory protein [Micromonospora auratinigra]
MTGPELRSGQLAEAAGVNPQTLRYYERRGLLATPRRSPGGHRLYPPDAVTLLRVIKTAQRLGFTLDEVAELLDAGRHRPGRPGTGPTGAKGGAPDCAQAHHEGGPAVRGRRDAGLRVRAEWKLVEVELRMADLAVIRDTLRAAVTAGCDDLLACADSSCCPLPFAGPTVRHDRSGDPADR